MRTYQEEGEKLEVFVDIFKNFELIGHCTPMVEEQ